MKFSLFYFYKYQVFYLCQEGVDCETSPGLNMTSVTFISGKQCVAVARHVFTSVCHILNKCFKF